MRYVMIICDEEAKAGPESPIEHAGQPEFMAWQEEVDRRGVIRGGERLRPTSDATTVRVRDGEMLVADGPFAETKEQMGGFTIIECGDLDEAIELAARHPVARWGTIEVRPIWET